MAKLEDREPIIDTPPHLSRHPKGIREKERFWLGEHRKRVRRYDTTRLRGSTQLRGSTRSLRKSEWDQKMRKMDSIIRCMIWYEMRYKMRCKLSTPGSPEYILPVTPSISATAVSPYAPVAQFVSIIPVSSYTRRSSVLCQAEWRWWWETDFPATVAHVGSSSEDFQKS